MKKKEITIPAISAISSIPAPATRIEARTQPMAARTTFLHPTWTTTPDWTFHGSVKIEWNKLPKVSYEAIKHQIKSGDVIAFAGTSLKSKLLRIVTDSPISHIGIALILHNTLYLLHSNTEKGVCLDPLDKDFPFVLIQHDLVWTQEHLIKSIKCLPAGYDLKSIILTGILNNKLSIPNPITNQQPIPMKKHFMCSDLVSFIWDIHQENIIPQKVMEWFMLNANGRAYFVHKESNLEIENNENKSINRNVSLNRNGIEIGNNELRNKFMNHSNNHSRNHLKNHQHKLHFIKLWKSKK